MDSPTTRQSPLVESFARVVAATGSALAGAFFLFVNLGGTVRGTVHPASLVAAAVWAGPCWIYARIVRTRSIALAGGAGLLAATAGFLVSLFRNTHSTAGIGVITIPMLLYPLAVGMLAIDRLVIARRTGEPALRGFARRLVAVGLTFVAIMAAVFTVVGIVSLFDPVTRDDYVVGSVVTTVISATTATGGFIAIKRLWRIAPPPPPPPRGAEDRRLS